MRLNSQTEMRTGELILSVNLHEQDLQPHAVDALRCAESDASARTFFGASISSTVQLAFFLASQFFRVTARRRVRRIRMALRQFGAEQVPHRDPSDQEGFG